MYDLFFLSYEEPFADEQWASFSARFPHAKRVHGVKGILAAHQECAKRSFTSHFFVIDADNEVRDFDFTYKIPDYDTQYTHLWYARNPVNRLEYGWGGLKLFPKKAVLAASSMGTDMTTGFDLKIIPEVASVTHFNRTEFDAWRSAFRECAKLSRLPMDAETSHRLETWRTKGVDKKNGAWVIDGACEGAMFAQEFRGSNDIQVVNDWDWLKARYCARYPGDTRVHV